MHVFIWIVIFFRIVNVPASILLGLWFAMQLVSGLARGHGTARCGVLGACRRLSDRNDPPHHAAPARRGPAAAAAHHRFRDGAPGRIRQRAQSGARLGARGRPPLPAAAQPLGLSLAQRIGGGVIPAGNGSRPLISGAAGGEAGCAFGTGAWAGAAAGAEA